MRGSTRVRSICHFHGSAAPRPPAHAARTDGASAAWW